MKELEWNKIRKKKTKSKLFSLSEGKLERERALWGLYDSLFFITSFSLEKSLKILKEKERERKERYFTIPFATATSLSLRQFPLAFS